MLTGGTIYRTRRPYILGSLFLFVFPFLLTLVVFTEGQAAQPNEWIGIGIFWVLSLLVVLIPFGFKLEVGNDYVKSYFFGILIKTLKSSDITVVKYDNLFRGGLGFGKGLHVRTKTGLNKIFSFGENLYGKEAIDHVQRVLES